MSAVELELDLVVQGGAWPAVDLESLARRAIAAALATASDRPEGPA